MENSITLENPTWNDELLHAVYSSKDDNDSPATEIEQIEIWKQNISNAGPSVKKHFASIVNVATGS